MINREVIKAIKGLPSPAGGRNARVKSKRSKKKVKKRIVSIIAVVILLLGIMVMPASAGPVILDSSGDIGNSNAAEIVVDTPGLTLGGILSIEWSAYVLTGYAPHADIRIDTSVPPDGVADDAVVFEYAYNGEAHYAEPGGMPYGVPIGVWFQTFDDDGEGPSIITDASFGWLSSGQPGPYPPVGGFTNGFIGGTLSEWKAGTIFSGIDADTPVVNIHIETDNWVVDTIAVVDNVLLNASSAVVSSVSVVPAPLLAKVSVNPASYDFGAMYPGTSKIVTVAITNIGNVPVDVSATGEAGTVFEGNVSGSLPNLGVGETANVDITLTIPLEASYESSTGNILFELTPL